MKKIFIILISLLFFTSCSSDAGVTDEVQTEALTVTEALTAAPTQSPEPAPAAINYDSLTAQYIRTNGYIDGREYPVATIIGSGEELAQYIDTYKDDYYFDQAGFKSISFYDAVEEYDDGFYSENVLILILLEEPSGSIRHKVTGTSVDDSYIAVDVKRLIPEIGTDDMAEWHIIIGLPREGVSSQPVIVNIAK